MGCVGACARLIVVSALLFLVLASVVLYAPIPESWAVQEADFSSDSTYHAELADFNRVVGLLKEACYIPTPFLARHSFLSICGEKYLLL
jgi:hypothetical protein